MHHRRHLGTAAGLVIGMAMLTSAKLKAQAPQPITSLPKPPVAAPAAVPPANTPDATAAERGDVHPITSLPKPAAVAPVAVAPAAMVPAAAVPLALPPSQPDAGATFRPTSSSATGAVDPHGASVSSAPAAAKVPVVVEPNMGEAPLHAEIKPIMPQREATVPQLRPFHSYGIQVKAGLAGAGLDIATPLTRSLNLRVGGSAFLYDASFNIDGIDIVGQVRFSSATASVDWYPFHNAFRISPGLTIYNGNSIAATAHVPGGQSFDLGDGTYTSSPSDPVHGTMAMSFGRTTAPSLTIGAGNLLPRGGGHFSVPFEIGFQYIGAPQLVLKLQGTSCQGANQCGDVATDPTSQANLKQEQDEVNSDIAPLRFYPIVSLGVGWRF